LAYSWRNLILPLAEAGYHVVAPDQRGYGRTTPVSRPDAGPVGFDEDPGPYRVFNVVRDVIALVHAVGYSSVHAIVGHDAGSTVAGYCALVRPDMFERVVLMSAPFTGPPSYAMPGWPKKQTLADMIPVLREGLAGLQPRRKHYALYFSTAEANADMHTGMESREHLRAFLRAYYRAKSAEGGGGGNSNSKEDGSYPRDLAPGGLSAPGMMIVRALAELPEYYVMRMDRTMPETVLHSAPAAGGTASGNAGAGLGWLPDQELGVYVEEFWRTGFQGGLNWYRCATGGGGGGDEEMLMFSRMRVRVPAMYIAGEWDWGTWQMPGAVGRMREVCTRMGPAGEGFVIVEGAGHWVQQEQPAVVLGYLLGFFKTEG